MSPAIADFRYRAPLMPRMHGNKKYIVFKEKSQLFLYLPLLWLIIIEYGRVF